MWKIARLFRWKKCTEKLSSKRGKSEPILRSPGRTLRIADLPETSDIDLRDAKWPPDPRFNKPFDVTQIVSQQGALIRRICIALPLSDEDLERYFLPAVWNVANFVHLLSASRDNHHRGYGGLFAHSLETSLYSVNIAKNRIFDFSEAPEVAFRNRSRWILACALAGLVHDVGKAVTDITVRTKQGDVWNPNEGPLGSWLEAHGRPEFTFSWNAERDYARHPVASLDYARKLVPAETYRFLTAAANRNIESELSAAILGTDEARNASLIAQIVRQADSLSVRLDNEAAGNIDKRDKLVTSEPADKVMLTIRELIAEEKWTVNGAESRVFVTNRGTFIVWSAVKDIVSRLRAQGYAGVPENRDIMASMLLDQGLIERPPQEVDTTRRLYWPVCPLSKRDEFISCVKVSVPERLFIGSMPAATKALVRRLPIADEEAKAWQAQWGFVPSESDEDKNDDSAEPEGNSEDRSAEKKDSVNASDDRLKEGRPDDQSSSVSQDGNADAKPSPCNVEAISVQSSESATSEDSTGISTLKRTALVRSTDENPPSSETTLPTAQEMLSSEEAAAVLGIDPQDSSLAFNAGRTGGEGSNTSAESERTASSASVAVVSAPADDDGKGDDGEKAQEAVQKAQESLESQGPELVQQVQEAPQVKAMPPSSCDSERIAKQANDAPGVLSEEEALAILGEPIQRRSEKAGQMAEKAERIEVSNESRDDGTSAGRVSKKSKKDDSRSTARQIREMLEELKRQMKAGEGAYVELGVAKLADGTLTANSLAFEKALKDAGISRMLVTSELSGFQPPPVLSADWAKSLFVLKF